MKSNCMLCYCLCELNEITDEIIILCQESKINLNRNHSSSSAVNFELNLCVHGKNLYRKCNLLALSVGQ